MNTVITTGCPLSGWEMVLPALRQAGFEPNGDSFSRWHDELFQAAGVDDPLRVNGPLQPESGLQKSASALVPEAAKAPQLLADSRSLWLLDFWAATLPQARFLLFYAPAETALAHALLHNVDPRLFLEGWQAAGRHMLRFQRRHRKRALLLDAEASARQPRAFIDACRRFGLSAEPRSLPREAASPLVTIERLVAGCFTSAQPALQVLLTELEASSQPLGDAASSQQPRPEMLYEDYLQRKRRFDDVVEQLQAIEQSQKQQVVENNQLLEELAQLTKARDEQAKLAAERQAQLDKARQAEQSFTTAAKEAAKENELLLLQLHQVQEELEATFLRKQQLEQAQTAQQQKQSDLAQLTKARDEQAKLAAERQTQVAQLTKARDEQAKLAAERQVQVAQLTKARDEQVKLAAERQAQVAQLTKARDEQAKLAAEHKAQLDKARQPEQAQTVKYNDAVKENELLLLQLHQVQEELEATFLQKQNLLQAQQRQETAGKGASGEKEQLLQQLRRLEEELKRKDFAIEEQRQRVEKLKQTASWKITAPVRAMARPFNGQKKKQKKTDKEMKQQIELLRASGLFDEAWYRSEYGDVTGNGVDPVEHYLLRGAAEGRNPSPRFNTNGYLAVNKDVAQTGMNPLVHYVKFGKAENRKGF